MTTNSITSIQRGIVFLMATWSGGSQWAYPKFVAFLKQHDIPSDQLHVFDVDQHRELYELPELVGKIHGWGEALVVKDGRIVFFTLLGKDQHLIQEHCDELLRFMLPDKSSKPTTARGISFAIAVHVASQRWLNFLS